MLYLFLSMTFLLWASYLVKWDISAIEKRHIHHMNGFVVVSIIAALSAKGMLTAAYNMDVFSLTLGELEEFTSSQGVSFDDWAITCMSIGHVSSILDHGVDFDFA
ncbi:hypothetical protein DFO70_103153 [Cytobacillus firmus]|uniref:Uncharacterized protein n=3 Tax=Cytobacillus TaxID=2675230 RepID=A0A366K041_CYTFI|nr:MULTISPECIES: hypothetical protein [Cytobacillus]RBP95119.1 hypothetical protein DFO70_103153 [Cytobacillus firmus]TDX43960.1 hypothetical protein DFO72_104166 [Cytobacillus oceanisediminis]